MLLSHQVVSNSSHHGLQHTRLPCPSPPPGVCPSSCPVNQWCHSTISPPVSLFPFCLQSFPASGSFPMNHLFASGSIEVLNWSIEVLKYWSFSISPSKEYSGLISLKIDWFDLFAFQGTVKSATVQKHQLFGTLPSLLCSSTSVHDYWKNHNLESFKHLHCLKSHCA